MLRLYGRCFNDMSKRTSTRHLIARPKIRESPSIEYQQKVAVFYRGQPVGDHDDRHVIA